MIIGISDTLNLRQLSFDFKVGEVPADGVFHFFAYCVNRPGDGTGDNGKYKKHQEIKPYHNGNDKINDFPDRLHDAV